MKGLEEKVKVAAAEKVQLERELGETAAKLQRELTVSSYSVGVIVEPSSE